MSTIVSERSVAVSTDQGMIQIWDFYTQQQTWMYNLQCQALCLFHAEPFFILGSQSHPGKLLVLNTQGNQASVYENPDTPSAIAMYENSTFLVGGCSGTLALWNTSFQPQAYAQNTAGAC